MMKTIDLKSFRRKAGQKKKLYTTFLKGLHRRKIRGIDALAKKLNNESFTTIDCRSCANCCKTMSPTYNKSDIRRISAHVKMTPAQYKEKYLYQDDSGDWMHYKLPCHFLGEDNLCTIYDIRPSDCRGFPHTHKRDFLNAASINIQNISYCPATLNIVEKMFEKIVLKKP